MVLGLALTPALVLSTRRSYGEAAHQVRWAQVPVCTEVLPMLMVRVCL